MTSGKYDSRKKRLAGACKMTSEERLEAGELVRKWLQYMACNEMESGQGLQFLPL